MKYFLLILGLSACGREPSLVAPRCLGDAARVDTVYFAPPHAHTVAGVLIQCPR